MSENKISVKQFPKLTVKLKVKATSYQITKNPFHPFYFMNFRNLMNKPIISWRRVQQSTIVSSPTFLLCVSIPMSNYGEKKIDMLIMGNK